MPAAQEGGAAVTAELFLAAAVRLPDAKPVLARDDPKCADGLQRRTAADASHLPFGDRISIELPFAVAGAEIEFATGQAKPKPLMKLVHAVAQTRPLLLIATVGFEREFDRAYTHGTKAQLWQLPRSAHTLGVEDHPRAYANRVLAFFNRGLS